MKTRLFEYRIQNNSNQKVLKEAPFGDFFRGLGKGIKNNVKGRLGLKTDEELASEAESAYKEWFNKVGFKELDTTGEQNLLKKYLIPLGKSDEGITLEIKKDEEFLKQIEDGEIEFDEENDKYKTILQFKLFDVPINVENVNKLINLDTNGLERLAAENNGTLQDTNEVSQVAIDKIAQANSILKSYNLNLFDASWNSADFEKFKKSLANNVFGNEQYNLMSNTIAKSLENKKLSMRQLCKIANVNTESDLADLLKGEENFDGFISHIKDGTLTQDVIDDLIKNQGLPKNYWGILLRKVMNKFFSEKFNI